MWQFYKGNYDIFITLNIASNDICDGKNNTDLAYVFNRFLADIHQITNEYNFHYIHHQQYSLHIPRVQLPVTVMGSYIVNIF